MQRHKADGKDKGVSSPRDDSNKELKDGERRHAIEEDVLIGSYESSRSGPGAKNLDRIDM